VLGGIVVRECQRGVQVIYPHDDALRDGLADDVYALQRVRLNVDLRLHFRKDRFWEIDADEYHLRIDAVLGLRKEVCRHVCGIASLVCDDLCDSQHHQPYALYSQFTISKTGGG